MAIFEMEKEDKNSSQNGSEWANGQEVECVKERSTSQDLGDAGGWVVWVNCEEGEDVGEERGGALLADSSMSVIKDKGWWR